MATAVSMNGVTVYNLTGGKNFPTWVAKRLMKKDGSLSRRVEIIQDFGFPSAAQYIAMTADGRYIISTGTYPPRVRIFDTAELSMKCERFMDATPLAVAQLSDDYTKLAFVQDDRSIEVHAAYGKHYRTRIPHVGRCALYHAPTAELLVGATGEDVYRLNLEEGRFMESLAATSSRSAKPTAGVNALAVSRVTALIGAAVDGGDVCLWDPRTQARVATLNMPPSAVSHSMHARASGTLSGEVDATALAFDEQGLGLVVGSSDSRALLYDLRKTTPLQVKHHQYGLPIKKIAFHRGSSDLIMSVDSKVVKFWNAADGSAFANVESPSPINDVCMVTDRSEVGGADSGLMFIAGEQQRIMAYYVPQLGVAPKWASFLDTLTEEVDAAHGGKSGDGIVFDDYRFVTRDELVALGLQHLVGTPLLRAYMHGYFVDAKLYNKVKAVADPHAYETWRKSKLREAIAAKQGSRIKLEEELPQVNRDLAARLREAERTRATTASGEAVARATGLTKAGSKAASNASTAVEAKPKRTLLSDSRFGKLFSDPAFSIDTEAPEYLQHNPHAAAGGRTMAGTKRGRTSRSHHMDSDAEEEEEEEE